MSFPITPNDGDLYSSPNGVIYRYSSADDRWDITYAEVQGMTGAQGNTGVSGSTGIAGTGITGLQGITGVQGLGTTGFQGTTGFRGTTGLPGVTGIPGVGTTGFQGLTGVQGVTGITGNTERYFLADQLDAPINALWPVTGIAPVGKDSNNLDLNVRLFDDTLIEGAGFILEPPNNTSSLTLNFRSKAVSSPTGASKVSLGLYTRRFPDNITGTNWTEKYQLTDIDIPTNTNYQYDSQTLTFSSIGMTGGCFTRLEISRDATNVNDTLVGDWGLALLKASIS